MKAQVEELDQIVNQLNDNLVQIKWRKKFKGVPRRKPTDVPMQEKVSPPKPWIEEAEHDYDKEMQEINDHLSRAKL